MPTVLRIDGFRFFFYSNEGNEPLHIHVEKAEAVAKIWLEPVSVEYNYGFSGSELKKILKLIEQNLQILKIKWYEYFGKK